MQAVDWIVLAVIAAAVVFAIRSIWKNRGACSGDCAACRRNCEKRNNEKSE